MVFSSLSWGGAANKHLSLLDRLQARASRLIERDGQERNEVMDSLQHRCDVGGMCVMFRVHQLGVTHLEPLRLPGRHIVRTTRSVVQAPAALQQPHSNTTHHRRQFTVRYCSMWNIMLRTTIISPHLTLDKFKKEINKWLKHN